MEKLKLPYRLQWYDRGADSLAPPEYLALHPAAMAPVIETVRAATGWGA
jgi:glutathione S-transferase